MSGFIFDLQRFDDVTIAKGQTHTLDGITYTATSDAVLNLDNAGKVSGIASGSVTATIDGATNSPTVIFDGTKAFEFTCEKSSTLTDTDIINVRYQNSSISYASGSVTYSGTGVTFPAGNIGLAGTIASIVPFNINMTVPDSGATVIFNDDGNVNLKSAETLTAAMTFPAEIKTLLENLKGILPLFLKISEESFEELYNFVTQLVSSTTTIALSGEAIYNRDAKTFSFAEGGTLDLNILNYGIKLTAVDGAIDGISLYSSKDGDDTNAGVKIVPNSGNGKLGVDITEDGKSIFKDVIQVTSGMLTLDPINSKFSADANTSFTIHVREVYVATLASTDAINLGLSADGNGNISLTLDPVPFTFTLQRDDITVFSGKFLISSGSLVFNGNAHSLTLTPGTTATMTYGEYEITFTATEAAGVEIVANENGTYSFTPGENDGSLNISLKQNGTTLFNGPLNVTGGTITFDPETQEFTFPKGTKFSIAPDTGNQQRLLSATNDQLQLFMAANSQQQLLTATNNQRQIDMEVVDGSASVKVSMDADGNLLIKSNENDGKLEISLGKDGTTNFQNTLSIGGAIMVNIAKQLFSLADKSTITAKFADYEITATASGDAAGIVTLTEDGVFITPNTSDGTLNLTLTGTPSGSLSANIELLSGGFFLGLDDTLSVTEGTELKMDFGNGYIINFKTNDTAGGALSIGEDGITFVPNADDGGLQLSVTRDGKTRSASLDVTGSVTYGLDGSISLAQGTVVRNVFDSGNVLTITANTDASGLITFNPQDGLTITPATPDALNVVLSTGDLDVIKVSSLEGTVNYKGGVITASDGTKARAYNFGWEAELSTTGGSATIQFTDDRTIYTANEGATFAVDYLNGTTTEFQNGSYTAVYAETIENLVGFLSEGTILRSNDGEIVFTLEKAGTYTINGMNITTTQDNVKVRLPDYNTATFAADAPITVSTADDGKLFFVDEAEGTIKVSTQSSDNAEVTGGIITFDNATKKVSCTAGTNVAFPQNDQVTTFTAPEEISASYKVEEGIYYYDLDNNATVNLSATNDEQTVFDGQLEVDGVFSYSPQSGTFGLTGGNSSHGNGFNTSAKITANNYAISLTTNDTTIVFIPKINDGKLEMNFPNERKHAMLFTLSKDGQTTFESNLVIDGTINFDADNKELSLTKGTVLRITLEGENQLEVTALDDVGGILNIVDDGLRFAPNSGDGALELNLVNSGRKANLNITGAIIFGDNGKISLEDGTEVTFDWEDGANLKMTSHGSTGSIAFGEKGIQITSDDENLDIDLTIATGVQTHLSGIKGTIYYNAGKISFDENSTITATTTLGGKPILMTLETIGGTGHLEFVSNGVIYSADTGAMKITWSKDDLESTFIVNSGSIQIGHGLFKIAEGTDLATDLKDFVPALYFTTSGASTYTINGHTITTTAENIPMTATDDYMSFTTSNGVVNYNGMTFAGAGNVSLSSSGVVLGAGVEATGFGLDNSFVLAETGNVTADARIFEMEVTEGVPMTITVTGAQDGFIFSRTLTKESEAYIDDVLNTEEFANYSSSYIGKVFTEEFIAEGDSSYRIQTDSVGLQKIIGISENTTITGGAILADEPTKTVFDVGTETEGDFTIGDKSYTINGDSSVVIMTDFEPDKSYARGFNDLNGTVSGDFTAHQVSINGSSSAVQAFGDTLIDIAADENGFEISGLDAGASLKVFAADTYTVNGTELNAKAEDVIVGLSNNGASLISNAGQSFVNYNSDTLITATNKADTITNYGEKVTINALGGNDIITNTGDNVRIEYSAGDGNDTITGFNETSTLSVGNNLYSTQQSDDDLIITVGENNITLVDAANLDEVNIDSPSQDSFDTATTFVNAMLHRTESGYPLIAEIALNPTVYHGDEPTNYASKETWTIESADGLELSGIHYTPENPNDKWVVIIHGYGHNHKHMYPFTAFYLENNYNILMVDQRAAGDSEGEWLTMGTAESADIALWTQEIARRNSDAKITLFGVSMGAATAILAAARDDTANVTSLVEDCGYSNVVEVIDNLNNLIFKVDQATVDLMQPVSESLTGYNLKDAAPINSISSVKVPTLFITGTNDSVVAPSMLSALYDASGAEVKETFIVEGANHGIAGLFDPIGYSNAVFRFIAEADEEGWETENISDDISLRGTSYNDTIESSGDNVTINTGAGDDSITNTGENVLFQYTEGDGNDTINGFNELTALKISGDYSTATSGDNVVVTVGENEITLTDAASLDVLNISNDITGHTINNTVDNDLVSGGAGDDSISNIGSDVTIDAGAGNDTITNYGTSSIVDGGFDSDIIENLSANTTIIGGGGNDSIHNSESNYVSLNAGAGKDTIVNDHSYYTTLEGGNGDDKIIVTSGHHTNIDGGAGNDSILGDTSGGWAMGGYATIDGGDGDDFINPIFSDSASIYGGDGNDTIINEGNDATINGGSDDDIISLHGSSIDNNVIEYEFGDGNDTIYGLNETGTISLTAGAEYSTVQSGDDVILTVGENKIAIAGGASLSTVNVVNYEIVALDVDNSVNNTLISGTKLDDTIENSGDNVTINGAAGNDYIDNTGASAVIDGGAGNDYIINDNNNSTLNGAEGDDYIENLGDNVSIRGSYGNDTIENYGANVTVKPDGGNDYILNFGKNALIDYAGGNDTIYGLKESDTLQIGGGSSAYETLEGEKDIIVLTNENIAVLKDALLNTDSLNINGDTIAIESKAVSLASGGDNVEINRDNISVTGGDGSDTISNSGVNVVINAGAGDDSVSNSGANAKINAAADDDFIQNTAASSSILGDTGNDTIVSRGHYNYIDGGAGDDNIFVTWDTANYDKNIALSSDPIEEVLDSMTLEEKIGQMMMVGVYSTVISDQIKSLLNDSLIGGVILFDKSMESLEQTKKLNDDMQAFSAQKAPLLIAVDEEGGIVARGKSFLEPAPSQESIGQTGDPDNANYWAKYNAGLLKSIHANINFAPVADVGTTDTRSFSADTDTVTQFVEAAAQGYEEENFIYTLKHFPGIGKSTVDTHDNISHVDASKEVLEEEDIPPFKKIIDDHDNSKFAVMVGHVIYDALDSVKAASFSPAVINNLLREELGYSGVLVTDDLQMGAIKNSINLAEMASGVIQAGGDIALDTSSNPKEVREALLNAVNQGTISEERINESVRRILNLKANLDTGSYATVNGGEGSDFIKVDYYTKDSSITGGAGNDTIANSGDNNTLDGGEGDDFISLSNGAALVKYAAGDGDDTISGFNATSTLSISGGNYSSAKSGDDLILTVGENTITLEDAATLTNPNIIGTITAETTTTTTEEIIASLIGSDSDEIITLTSGGAQDINLSKEDYDVVVVDANATGRKNISLDGGNLAVIEDSNARVSVTASKGEDTIVSSNEKVFVSLRGGKTDIFAQEGKMTVAGYNASTGSGFQTDYDDILTAINDGEILFNKNQLTIGSAVIYFENDNKVINLYDASGDLQKVGEALPDTALNLSKEKSDMIISADENSTLTSGAGDDTIFAFEGSHIDAGAGKNYIYLEERSANADGAAIVLSNAGKNTIANFKSGFEDTSDKLFVGVKDNVDCTFDGTDLKVKVNDKLRGIVSNVGDGAPFVNFLIADANGSKKIVAAQNGANATVDDELADLYMGKKSGVDFSGYSDTLNLDLSENFYGINQITVGSGLNTLIGSSANETLTGNSDGITEYVFGAGGGRDVIANFNFDGDKINVGTDAVTNVKLNSAGNVRLQVGGGEDWLTIEDAQGKNFKINNFVAKVDNNIDFDDAANYYVATARNATLTVGDGVEGDAVIWLDNPARNGSVFKGDIKTLDASNATVKTELAGNDLDNIILAGDGDASLWGGNGGNDLLTGGAGKNMFFYTNGNGSDTISGANDGDVVYLSSVALENIVGADFTDDAVAVNFADGGKLTVNEQGKEVDFVVGEQTFRVNKNHNGFELK